MKVVTAIKKLEELVQAAGDTLYDRVKYGLVVFSDADYVAEHHEGDQAKCAEFLTAKYFPDLSLSDGYDFLTLRDIYEKFPRREQWKAHRYALQVMLAEVYADRQRESKNVRKEARRVTIKEYDALQDEKKSVEFHLNRVSGEKDSLREEVGVLKNRICQLEARIRQLEAENADLRSKVYGEEVTA